MALFLLAAGQYAWNAYSVPPLTGYDAGGHAGYVLTLVEEWRLPHPMDPAAGWSTFHPPLYYIIGSVIWSLLDPLGPRAVLVGLRGISAIACLAAGVAAYLLVRRLTASWIVASVATALVLFTPSIQMASAMIGNEALAFGLGAVCLVPLLRLHRDPGDLRTAIATGVLSGLAVATKYSAAFVLAASVVPFIRRDLDRRMLRGLYALALAVTLVAGPFYARNVVVAGTPLPMLRGMDPMKKAEAQNVLRPRKLVDYAWLDPACLFRPSLHHVGAKRVRGARNMAMTNVWGLAYASTWYDAFAHRIPPEYHRDGIRSGPMLALLGILPTLMVLVGFVLACRSAVRHRGRSPDAPLVAIWIAGLLGFVVFTWSAPSADAAKGSYLLPLAVPGAVFFGRGVTWLAGPLRPPALLLSASAALAAALIFTNALVFPPREERRMVDIWRAVGHVMPDSHIGEAAERLGGLR